jgi:hypothetical protein
MQGFTQQLDYFLPARFILARADEFIADIARHDEALLLGSPQDRAGNCLELC